MAARGCYRFCGGEDKCLSSRGCDEYADFTDDSTGSSRGLCESRQNDDGSFLFRVDEGTFSEENMRDIEERVRESKLVSMVQEPIYRAGKKLSEINKGERARKDDMSGVFSSTVADQRKKENPKRNSVTFNPEVTVHLIPYEDLTGPRQPPQQVPRPPPPARTPPPPPPKTQAPPVCPVPPLSDNPRDKWIPAEGNFISESGNTLMIRSGPMFGSRRSSTAPPPRPPPPVVKEEPSPPTEIKEEPLPPITTLMGRKKTVTLPRPPPPVSAVPPAAAGCLIVTEGFLPPPYGEVIVEELPEPIGVRVTARTSSGIYPILSPEPSAPPLSDYGYCGSSTYSSPVISPGNNPLARERGRGRGTCGRGRQRRQRRGAGGRGRVFGFDQDTSGIFKTTRGRKRAKRGRETTIEGEEEESAPER
uniref:Formin-like protein 14 n=1 Tax=Crassostrea virginica TaxID=6565 RepID=A0A8B8E6G4_CRAVI|nr:formin-like protein 14 [Crassostrea virginica]